MNSFSNYASLIGVIVSLLAIVGGVFSFVKFSIIDSRDINYQTLVNNYEIQINTLNTTLAQYEAKISYLELENQTLTAERDKYYSYLINIPESIYYLESIIADLEKKNLELQSSTYPTDAPSEEKYYISYDNKKENLTDFYE